MKTATSLKLPEGGSEMKFICPKCKKDTEIEVVMTDCIVAETIKYNKNLSLNNNLK